MSHPAPGEALAAHRVFIGSITPSGNTIVERITLGILREFPEVSGHFSRTPVFGSVDPFPDGYDTEGMLAAARLLAHAAPDVLIWNGSKGGSLDFRLDHDFVASVKAATGLACTTSTLALDEVLRRTGVTRYALVSPYDGGYQQKIISTFRREGYECVAEAHCDLRDNLSFARVPAADIAAMLRRVAAARPQAIVTFCTNFPAGVVAADMEAELDIPIYDSTVLPVWKGLKMAGVDTTRGRAWGRLFAL
jgi:maleate isomerase